MQRLARPYSLSRTNRLGPRRPRSARARRRARIDTCSCPASRALSSAFEMLDGETRGQSHSAQRPAQQARCDYLEHRGRRRPDVGAERSRAGLRGCVPFAPQYDQRARQAPLHHALERRARDIAYRYRSATGVQRTRAAQASVLDDVSLTTSRGCASGSRGPDPASSGSPGSSSGSRSRRRAASGCPRSASGSRSPDRASSDCPRSSSGSR